MHAWTFRRENNFLSEEFRRGNPADPTYLRQYGDFAGELRLFYSHGLDGVFADQPDVAVSVRNSSDD